jgi:hypothetical protein
MQQSSILCNIYAYLCSFLPVYATDMQHLCAVKTRFSAFPGY